ncbi:MAG: CoA transferase [Albidovulum sp.]
MRAASLDGIRVLDLTRVLAGPFCTALLGDLGAEIIKIETPDGDDYRHLPPFCDGTGGLFHLLNRGKKSVALNLRSDEGRGILRDLSRSCDVIIENFRPGVMAEMGLSYDDLSRENPQLIQVSISGFGQQSPMGNAPVYDLIIQALTGFMSISGEPDGPPMMTGESVADLTAGLFASWSVLAALIERGKSGLGQYVDVAMFDCLFSFLPAALAQHFYGATPPTRVGNRHPLGAPFGVFRAADGHFTIAVLNPRQFVKLATAMGQPNLADDARFSNNAARNDNHAALKSIIEQWSSTQSVAGIVGLLKAHDVPGSAILTVPEAAAGAQVSERGLLRRVETAAGHQVITMTQPVRFSQMPQASGGVAPALGQDGPQVLADILGKSEAAIEALCRGGVLHPGKPGSEG